MELNLKPFNATEITFEVTLPLSATGVAKLQSCFIDKKTKKEQSKSLLFVFGRDYKVDEQVHYERAIIFKSGKTGNKYTIIISYSLQGPIFGLPFNEQQLVSMDKLFDCLNEIDKETILDVKAFFSYSDEKYTTISSLHLPIKVDKNDTFDEIRGVRFTKTQDDKVIYSIVVDRPTNKNIFTNLFFQYVGRLDKELSKNIIKYSTEISRRFVNEK